MTEMGAARPLCSFLEWDSNFFARRIARLHAPRLDRQTVADATRWCHEKRIDCLYFLAEFDHAETCRLAEANDFHFVDERVTYECRVAPPQGRTSAAAVRLGLEEDLKQLRPIARHSHRDSRFYFDGHFDREQCDLLYETWIENSFRGFAQAVLVAEWEGAPAAYLTCHHQGAESQIGLVGVSAACQGKGLGSTLVQAFLAWSRERGAARAKVVTQGRNVGAQRLYQKNGFALASAQLWYHRWFPR